jgi:hypothetical protein
VIDLFDRIQLSVPASWGNMEHADPPNAATTAPAHGENLRIIDWQQVPPMDPDHNYGQLRERKSRPLTVHFEKPIPPQSSCPDGSRRPSRGPSPALPVSASTCRVASRRSGNWFRRRRPKCWWISPSTLVLSGTRTTG